VDKGVIMDRKAVVEAVEDAVTYWLDYAKEDIYTIDTSLEKMIQTNREKGDPIRFAIEDAVNDFVSGILDLNHLEQLLTDMLIEDCELKYNVCEEE